MGHATWRGGERLSRNARAVLKVLRKEWEMATSDLRVESGVTDRVAFTRAIDELQAAMIVIPSEVVYLPKFTYIWTLGVGRFPDALMRRVNRQTALREIARCFLAGAGMTIPASSRASPVSPVLTPALAIARSLRKVWRLWSREARTSWHQWFLERAEISERTDLHGATEKRRISFKEFSIPPGAHPELVAEGASEV
jgi:hypothetical protein